jgi:hypothetical protein
MRVINFKRFVKPLPHLKLIQELAILTILLILITYKTLSIATYYSQFIEFV